MMERARLMRLFVAVLLVLSVVGCSKVDDELFPPVQSNDAISFVPSVKIHDNVKLSGVKSLIEDADDLQEYSISLLGTAKRNSTVSKVFGNRAMSFSSGWSYGDPEYWIPGALYSFAAFCPYALPSGPTAPSVLNKSLTNGTVTYTEDGNNPTISIAGYNTGKKSDSSQGASDGFDARCEDLLFEKVTRDNTLANDYSSVGLQMEHLLACLEFCVRNATNEDIVKIYNISLTGLKYKCDIDIDCSTGAVVRVLKDRVSSEDTYFSGDDIGDGSTAVLPKGMSNDSYEHLFDCDYLTVLPQDVRGEEIKLNFTVKFYNQEATVDYSVNLGKIESMIEWVKGMKYRFTLTISSQDIYFQVVEVPWVVHYVEL